MDEDFKIDWPSIVNETINRRKKEGINQKTHAALANVSVPTMAAFENADTSLSLSKAFDIMRIVDMIEDVKPATKHDLFCEKNFKDWSLHNDVSHGYIQIDSYYNESKNDGMIGFYNFKEDFQEQFRPKLILDISTIIRELHDFLCNINSTDKFTIRIIARGLKNRFLHNWSMPNIQELEYYKGRNITRDEIYIEETFDRRSVNTTNKLIKIFFTAFGIQEFDDSIIDKVIYQYNLRKNC